MTQLRCCLRLLRPLTRGRFNPVGHFIKFTVGVFVAAQPSSEGVGIFSSALALVAALLLGFVSSQEAGVEFENLRAADARFNSSGAYGCVTLTNSYGFFDGVARDAAVSTQFAIESATSIYALTASLICTVTAMLSHASLRSVDPEERGKARHSGRGHDELDAHAAHVRLWRWNRFLLMAAFALLLVGIVTWMNSIYILRLINFPVKHWERECAAATAAPPSVIDWYDNTPAGIWRKWWWFGFCPILILIVFLAGTGVEHAHGIDAMIDAYLHGEPGQPAEAPQREQQETETGQQGAERPVSAENLGSALSQVYSDNAATAEA